MTDSTKTGFEQYLTERNLAGQALFQMQFGILMIGSGRMELAAEAFNKAETILIDLEARLDEENS